MELAPEPVDIDGKRYELTLRFKRNYKPYAIHLLDVRKDDYVGTDTPRNYSSEIKLVYPESKGDRKVSIWMNNPLRYAGETFYQSGYHNLGGREMTTLQVVRNTGWMIPYLGCMIVVVGMVVQFGTTLVRFAERGDVRPLTAAGAIAEAIRRESKRRHPVPAAAVPVGPSGSYAIPALVVLALGSWLLTQAQAPRPVAGQFDFYQFGQLPIVYEGRVKPLDTLARNTLRLLSGKQYYVSTDGTRQPAIRWLLDLIADPKAAFGQRVIRIDNPEVLGALGLAKRDEPDAAAGAKHKEAADQKDAGDGKAVKDTAEKDDAEDVDKAASDKVAAEKVAADKEGEKPARRSGSLYSLSELMPCIRELEEQAERTRDVDVHHLTTFQKKIIELDKKVMKCVQLRASFMPLELPPNPTPREQLAIRERVEELRTRPTPRVIPPDTKDGQWQPFAIALLLDELSVGQGKPANGPVVAWEAMLHDYAQHDVAGFNQTLGEYRASLAQKPPKDLNQKKTEFEALFNHAEPFFWACILDGVAFLLTCLSWFGFRRTANRTALWLLILVFTVHTLGLVARIYISGRPPVTNLYSSAVFIGWAAMLAGIVFEVIFGLGIGNLVASVAGFGTLAIAHFLAGDGDTFTVLQAVLDTQFWLATHVVCVTLGYATTFVAGLLGIIYVLAGTLSPVFDRQLQKTLARLIYGTVCFAMFFSFFGTVLGGLWADDSWGRFWGWDPKENGALIIVLWNAVLLHARWGGMVKDRGLAVLAMAGNIVTAWSWFGVNELGAGLHSYGFTEGVAKTLAIAIGVQLGLIGLGLVPKKLWPLVGRGPVAATE